MESTFPVSAIERARKTTILLVLAIDVLLLIVTMANGRPSIWSDFDKEKNVWTYGNSLNMVFVSVVAYVNYLLISGRRGSSESKSAWVWAFLALAFLFLSADDWLILHERGGHAIEHAVPFLSRHHIVLYMDDLLQLAYVAAAAIFGMIFLRRIARARNALRLYMYGVASVLAATLIGLPSFMKSLPFPMALIQVLQLVGVYLFFVSFLNCTAAELASAAEPTAQLSTRTAILR